MGCLFLCFVLFEVLSTSKYYFFIVKYIKIPCDGYLLTLLYMSLSMCVVPNLLLL